MKTLEYQGPHDGVEFSHEGKDYAVARGGTVEVPDELAEQLLAQGRPISPPTEEDKKNPDYKEPDESTFPWKVATSSTSSRSKASEKPSSGDSGGISTGTKEGGGDR